MLDRGEQLDWFSSNEILLETAAGGARLLSVPHPRRCWPSKPFISPRMFADRNFTSGVILMFAVGMILVASSALLAPYLQTLGGYPVREAGPPDGAARRWHHDRDDARGSTDEPGRSSPRHCHRHRHAWPLSLWMMTGLDARRDDHGRFPGSASSRGLGSASSLFPLQLVAFATLPTQYPRRWNGACLA